MRHADILTPVTWTAYCCACWAWRVWPSLMKFFLPINGCLTKRNKKNVSLGCHRAYRTCWYSKGYYFLNTEDTVDMMTSIRQHWQWPLAVTKVVFFPSWATPARCRCGKMGLLTGRLFLQLPRLGARGQREEKEKKKAPEHSHVALVEVTLSEAINTRTAKYRNALWTRAGNLGSQWRKAVMHVLRSNQAV